MKLSIAIAVTLTLLMGSTSFANLPAAKQLPINHCYHWLNQRTDGFLTFKYDHAQKSGGEFSFYSTAGNGAVAGAGIYCAKTLLGSYTYGDRVVRLEFVDDLVATDGIQQVCGTNGNFYANPADCSKQPADIHLYNKTNEWYVIKNPRAIKSWTANDATLIADLNAIKAFGDSAASSHMDLTLQLMQTEAQKIPHKTYVNPSARLDLIEILKDSKKIQEIPILTLVEMIAAASKDKISNVEKTKLFNTHLFRALKDPLLAFSDYENLLSKFPEVKDRLKNLVAGVNYSSLAEMNTVVLIAAADKLEVNLGREKIRELWKALWGSKNSFESLLSLNLKPESALLKQFDAFIPANFDIDEVKNSNIAPLLGLLDTYLPAGGSSYQRLTEKLFDKILRSPNYYQAKSTYDKMKNPTLFKEQALATVFRQLVTAPVTNMDLLTLSSLFEQIKNQLTADQVKKLQTQISSLPIKISPQLTYLLLDEYKTAKLKLPSFISRKDFLNRLVERSISERTLGAGTTNTYRLILSGFYALFADEIKAAKTDPERLASLNEGAAYFSQLATLLERSHQYPYAFAAWQNAQYFDAAMKYQSHPIEVAFANYSLGKKSSDGTLENMVTHGLDTGVLLYLIDNLAQDDRATTDKAEALLTKFFKNYTSAEFQAKIKDKNFQVIDNEKRIWANFLANKKLAPRGTVKADLCTMSKAIHDSQAVISVKFAGQWPQIETVKNQIYASCRQ